MYRQHGRGCPNACSSVRAGFDLPIPPKCRSFVGLPLNDGCGCAANDTSCLETCTSAVRSTLLHCTEGASWVKLHTEALD